MAEAEPPLIAVVGPTASGKSVWGLALAEAGGGEIIGADSQQVYRGLDIGTAKPSAEARARVRHHLIDHVDPRERYHLVRFLREARAAIADVRGRGRRPVLVGGTGQYVRALLEGWSAPEVEPDMTLRAELTEQAARHGAAALHAELTAVDPVAATRIDSTNIRRVARALEVYRKTGRPISSWHDERAPLPAVIVAPLLDRTEIDVRVEKRVETMFALGLVEEVRALLTAGVPRDAPGLAGIGYREVVRHLAGEMTQEETVKAVKAATRKLVRRQLAWFRLDDPRIQWLSRVEEARALVGDP